MLLQDSLERNAIVNQDKTALIFDDKRFSYGEIDRQANSLANALIENGLRETGSSGNMPGEYTRDRYFLIWNTQSGWYFCHSESPDESKQA